MAMAAMSDSNGPKGAEWMAAETLAEQLLPLLDRYDIKWRGHGLIYVDHEQYNIATAHRVLADLSSRLGVSHHLVRSRLIELGWFNDARDTLPVRGGDTYVINQLGSCAAIGQRRNDPEMDEGYDED